MRRRMETRAQLLLVNKKQQTNEKKSALHQERRLKNALKSLTNNEIFRGLSVESMGNTKNSAIRSERSLHE